MFAAEYWEDIPQICLMKAAREAEVDSSIVSNDNASYLTGVC